MFPLRVIVVGFLVGGDFWGNVGATLPVVDKGVFVITGVKTCGGGTGYCILGGDCTVDKEFIADTGHCDGLRKAFTPRAYFVCCSFVNDTITTTTTPVPTTTLANNNNGSGSGGDGSTTTIDSVLDSDEEDTTRIDVTSSGSHSVESVESPELSSDEQQEQVSAEEEVVTTMTSSTSTFVANYSSCQGPSALSVTAARVNSSRLAAIKPPSGVNTCWMAALVRRSGAVVSGMGGGIYSDPGAFLCTGALVHSNYVVTTATCVSRLFGQDFKLFRVAVGSRHLLHPGVGQSPDAVYRDVESLIIHEEFNHGPRARVNDIALVKLKPLEEETPSYCTVCLPERDHEDHGGEECLVAGYSHPTGTTGGGPSTPQEMVPGILHTAEQYLESNCDNLEDETTNGTSFVSRSDVTDNGIICAYGKIANEACFSPRDAGSPLVCASPTGYRLIGVFSSGFHCGTTSTPVLYTDLSAHLNWVNKYIQ